VQFRVNVDAVSLAFTHVTVTPPGHFSTTRFGEIPVTDGTVTFVSVVRHLPFHEFCRAVRSNARTRPVFLFTHSPYLPAGSATVATADADRPTPSSSAAAMMRNLLTMTS